MKKIKRIMAVTTAVLMAISMVSCSVSGNATSSGEQLDTVTKEIRQNDYRGGVTRTYAIQESVLEVMENMKSNNVTIRADSPNSFWTNDAYQDFVVNFLNAKIIDDTQWFNEEEDTWEATVVQMLSVNNSFTRSNNDGTYTSNGAEVIRNEKDDYAITGVKDNYASFVGDATYRILYDCDKDWCKAYATISVDSEIPDITTQLFEYARISNDIFAIQTSTERLIVELKPVEADDDIRNREITAFYYSKLVNDRPRSTFEAYEPLIESDILTGESNEENVAKNRRMENYRKYINENGECATMYGVKDSMFLTDNILKNINSDWVFEDKCLQQAIIYKDGALVVTTYNKLSEKYERFSYALEGVSEKTVTDIENMIEISGLQKNMDNQEEINPNEDNNSSDEPTKETTTTPTVDIPEETTTKVSEVSDVTTTPTAEPPVIE